MGLALLLCFATSPRVSRGGFVSPRLVGARWGGRRRGAFQVAHGQNSSGGEVEANSFDRLLCLRPGRSQWLNRVGS